MLWLPPSAFGKTETNLTVSDRNGATITASSAVNTKGLYSAGQLIATTAEDTYGVTVAVQGLHIAATKTAYLLDIGIGPSGSEVDLIQDLDCWGATLQATAALLSKSWYFPVFIPKGERVAARAQANAASDTAQVAIWLHQAADGWSMEVPNLWERLGTVTTSRGVSVTPASGAFGSWTTILDPTTKPYRWWHVGYDALDDTTILLGEALVELGFGETSAAVTTIGSWLFPQGAAESIGGPVPNVPVFAPLPSDTVNGIFARIASMEAEARGVLVYAGQ